MTNPALLTFDYAEFVANPIFAQYSNPVLYPEAVIQAYWNNAINYISNIGNFGAIQGAQRQNAIDLMTAHLMFLSGLAQSGQVPGLVQTATIDKVSVGLTPPPLPNQFQWWMNLSPYGQMLLAMLQANSVGGWYVGGSPVRAGFLNSGCGGWPWLVSNG